MIIRQNENLMLDKCYLCGQENEMFLFCTNCGTKISCNINPYYLEEMRCFLKSALDIEKNYYHLQRIGENIESEIKTTETLARSHFNLNTGNLSDTEINDAIDMVISSLKPVMLFIMGSLLIWIIVGVFGPIYGSFSKMM